MRPLRFRPSADGGRKRLWRHFIQVKRISQLGLTVTVSASSRRKRSSRRLYAPHLFRGGAARLLRRAFPSATLAPADELLARCGR